MTYSSFMINIIASDYSATQAANDQQGIDAIGEYACINNYRRSCITKNEWLKF